LPPLHPDAGPPPRHVEPWTRVVGHVPVRDPQRPFCACGWSAAGEDPQTAVNTHLREAWPVLVPRLDGETHEQWRDRVAVEHAAALDARERAWDRNDMGRGIQPGERIPVTPDDYSAADTRAEVLEHQLTDLTERLNRSRGAP
jgi:hypothetical protein